MKNVFAFLSLLFLSFNATTSSIAAESKNSLAVGQGVSAPTSTSLVNYSSGFTHENPIGAIYQKGNRISLMYDDGDGEQDAGKGAEFGIGNNNYGLAIGYYDACENCDGDLAASLAGVVSGIGLGLRLEENNFTFGAMMNPTGQHRIGLTVDLNTSGNDDVKSYGVGYAMVNSGFTFSIDASKRDSGNNSQSDDIILLTPGLMVSANNMLSLSISYDMHLNEPNGSNSGNDLWFGVGIASGALSLAAYMDYVDELAFVGTYSF